MGKRKGKNSQGHSSREGENTRTDSQGAAPQQQHQEAGGANANVLQMGPPQAQPQQHPQAGGAWQRGPPQAQQQQHPQAGGAWQRGPPPLQTQDPRRGGAWQRGPPPSQTQDPRAGGAWQRGPPPPQAQDPRAGGAWQRGPPPPQTQDPRAGGTWQRGPPPQDPQAMGDWQRGPPPQDPQAMGDWQRGPPPQDPQAMGDWQRGPPQYQPQHPQAGGAWQMGPPPQDPQAMEDWQRGSPQFQPQHPQAGGAWQMGPPPQDPQAMGDWQMGPPPQDPQAMGDWQRGPPQYQSQHPQAGGAWQMGPPPQHPQAAGAWQRGSSQARPHAQSSKFRDDRETEDSPVKQRMKQSPQAQRRAGEKPLKSERKRELSVMERTLEFAPRIYAPKKPGRELKVFANFFRLTIMNPNITVYHYDVTIEPDKPKFLLRDVWNKYVSLIFPGRLIAFDGKNAYSKGPLSDNTGVTTVKVKNPERQGIEKEFNVSIQFAQTINWSCFERYREKVLQSRDMKVLPELQIAVLDIILRNSACDNSVRCGRSFFPLSSKLRGISDLSPKLSLKLGYFQSAVLGYVPFLNFDISHKAFYKECQLIDIVETYRNRYNGSIELDEMSRFLKMVKVEYQLPNDAGSRRILRVNKLVGNALEQTFTKEDGSKMSVAEYFATEKKCPIRFPDLPTLWVGPTQKSIYVPMEFCKIVPDQVYKGVLEAREQREMVRGATSNARQRKEDIYRLFNAKEIHEDPFLKEFGLQVSTEMEKVPARVLDPPILRTENKTVRVRDGTWNIQNFLDPVILDKWCILVLDKRVRRESVIKLQKMLKSRGNDFNMKISDPVRDPIEGDPSFPGLKKAFSQLRGMKLVFVIISDAKGVYSKVKAICETQEGILTQCIKGGTVGQDERKLFTTVQNILLKVNAKLGGKNHCLDKNSVPPCLNGKVMVIGADVTHPSPGLRIPSVAAVTVSCCPESFQYGTTTSVQPKGEMIKDMQEIISIHLRKFLDLRGSYPEKIIFFRDGVSEGELEKVYKGELAAVKNACKGLCEPKITFVVVQKRHHTRLFPTCQEDEVGRNFNVPVGTCVDSVIVHPRDLDFYLVSHASILGTARPTRYRLLHDDNKLTDAEIQILAFYLCHLFSRCTRSVSYPSPTYNAHLAAARIRAYMEGLNLTGDQDIDLIKRKLKDNISNTYPMFFV